MCEFLIVKCSLITLHSTHLFTASPWCDKYISECMAGSDGEGFIYLFMGICTVYICTFFVLFFHWCFVYIIYWHGCQLLLLFSHLRFLCKDRTALHFCYFLQNLNKRILIKKRNKTKKKTFGILEVLSLAEHQELCWHQKKKI